MMVTWQPGLRRHPADCYVTSRRDVEAPPGGHRSRTITARGLRQAMGKASKAKRDGSSRQQRIAAQRAAQRRAEIRNRVLIASGSVVVVIAIVLAFVLVKVNSHGSSGSSASGNGPTGTALATVVKNTTAVPASTLNSVRARRGDT